MHDSDSVTVLPFFPRPSHKCMNMNPKNGMAHNSHRFAVSIGEKIVYKVGSYKIVTVLAGDGVVLNGTTLVANYSNDACRPLPASECLRCEPPC